MTFHGGHWAFTRFTELQGTVHDRRDFGSWPHMSRSDQGSVGSSRFGGFDGSVAFSLIDQAPRGSFQERLSYCSDGTAHFSYTSASVRVEVLQSPGGSSANMGTLETSKWSPRSFIIEKEMNDIIADGCLVFVGRAILRIIVSEHLFRLGYRGAGTAISSCRKWLPLV